MLLLLRSFVRIMGLKVALIWFEFLPPTGTICDVNINECDSMPCQNGAVCEDDVNDYVCRCPDPVPYQLPWGGHNCNIVLTGCVDEPCHNGGTCEPLLLGDKHHYICRCPPGFCGELCSTPTTFSFSKGSYVLVEVPHNTGETKVVMRFRTTLPDVVLFFRGNAETFLTLEMKDGDLLAMAQWGGFKLMVELHGDFNDGLWHWAAVSVNEKLALILLDDNDTSAVDGGHNQLLFFQPHGMEKVYIGQVPIPEYMNKTKTQVGFIGCIEDLVIDFQYILPQNFSQKQAMNIQLGCQKSEWCQPDSCLQRGHCIDLWTEYKCDCRRPFYGNICAHEHSSWTFSHEHNRSFVAFPITRSHSGNISVSFFLRSLQYDGLVLQLKRGNQAYFTVFLRRGKINVAVYSSIRESSTFITDGLKVLVTIDIRNGLLYFNDTESHFSTGTFREFDVAVGDMGYLGGLPEADDTIPWGGHFKGCLQDVRLDNTQLNMHLAKALQTPNHSSYFPNSSYNLLEHCISDYACKTRPCLNGGQCHIKWNDFVCSCPVNYTGKLCDTQLWCVSDPCIMGSQCVDLPDGYECLANATFNSNTLKYSANGSLSSTVTSVSVELRTQEESGTLLYASSGPQYLSMGLLNSSILVKIHNRNSQEKLAFTSRVGVSDGTWHHVDLRNMGSHHSVPLWHLVVDGQVASFSQAFAGNLDFFNNSIVWLAENFTGCLGEVRIGGVYLPLVAGIQKEVPQLSRFTQYGGKSEPQLGCSGAPLCLSEPCLNNGSCQDLFNRYTCNCAPGWEGEICQDDVDECSSVACVHGTCKNLLGEYQCQCVQGYKGRHCDEDVDECQELRCQNRGSCVNTVGGYSCVCPPEYSGLLCQWHFPPLQCGVGVQCANGGVCLDGPWGANCTCSQGYTGERCEVDIDECESNPCLNEGTCLDQQNHYLCACLTGFSGDSCEIPKQQQRERVPWLVVAIPLMCFGALLAVVGLTCMVLTARRKRQSEGTYSPSQQEVAGARLEMGSVLKVPPEERLI